MALKNKGKIGKYTLGPATGHTFTPVLYFLLLRRGMNFAYDHSQVNISIKLLREKPFFTTKTIAKVKL